MFQNHAQMRLMLLIIFPYKSEKIVIKNKVTYNNNYLLSFFFSVGVVHDELFLFLTKNKF